MLLLRQIAKGMLCMGTFGVGSINDYKVAAMTNASSCPKVADPSRSVYEREIKQYIWGLVSTNPKYFQEHLDAAVRQYYPLINQNYSNQVSVEYVRNLCHKYLVELGLVQSYSFSDILMDEYARTKIKGKR